MIWFPKGRVTQIIDLPLTSCLLSADNADKIRSYFSDTADSFESRPWYWNRRGTSYPFPFLYSGTWKADLLARRVSVFVDLGLYHKNDESQVRGGGGGLIVYTWLTWLSPVNIRASKLVERLRGHHPCTKSCWNHRNLPSFQRSPRLERNQRFLSMHQSDLWKRPITTLRAFLAIINIERSSRACRIRGMIATCPGNWGGMLPMLYPRRANGSKAVIGAEEQVIEMLLIDTAAKYSDLWPRKWDERSMRQRGGRESLGDRVDWKWDRRLGKSRPRRRLNEVNRAQWSQRKQWVVMARSWLTMLCPARWFWHVYDGKIHVD